MVRKKRVLGVLLAAMLLFGMLPATGLPPASAAETEVVQVRTGSADIGTYETFEAAFAAIDARGAAVYEMTLLKDVTVPLPESAATLTFPDKPITLNTSGHTLTFAAATGAEGVVEATDQLRLVGDIRSSGTVSLLGNGHTLILELSGQEGGKAFSTVYGGGSSPETSSLILLLSGEVGAVEAGGLNDASVTNARVILAAAATGSIKADNATAAQAYYVGPAGRAGRFDTRFGTPIRLGGFDLVAGDTLGTATPLATSGWTNKASIWAEPKATPVPGITVTHHKSEGEAASTDPILMLSEAKKEQLNPVVKIKADATFVAGGVEFSCAEPVTVGIDKTAPAQPALTATGGNRKVVLTATATDPLSGIASYAWYVVENSVGRLLGEGTANTYTHEGLALATSYTYYVVVTDAAGNLSTSSAQKTAKTNSAASLSYGVGTTGDKGWNNKNFSITITYSPTEGYALQKAKYALTKSETKLQENHTSWNTVSGNSVTVDIKEEGNWYLHVNVGDNSSNSDLNICVGQYALDKTKPVLASGKTYYKNLSSTSVTITGEQYSDALSKELQYAFVQSRNTPTAATWQTGKTKTFSGLSAKTDYSFWMRAKDEAGNETDWELITLTTTAAGATTSTGGGGGGVIAVAPTNFETLKNDMIRLGTGSINVSPSAINITQSKHTLRPIASEGVSKAYVPIQVVDSLNSQVQTRGTSFSLEINSVFGSLILPINFVQDHEELSRKLVLNNIGRSNGYLGIVQTERSYDATLAQQLRNVLPNATVVRAGEFSVDLVVETGASYGALSSFAQPLTHVFNIPADTELGTRWGVVRRNGSDFEFVPGRLVDGQVHSATTGNSVYVVIKNEVAFDDVESGAWFYDYVGRAAAKKLLVGVGDNLFQPDRSITRAEFVQLLVRGLMLPAAADVALPYDDVSAEDWYTNAIGRAYAAGLLGALPRDRFNPNTPILREEMAALLSAAATYGKLPAKQLQNNLAERFTDAADRNASYDAAVLAALERGFMEGMGDGTFAFKGHSTRAQAAKVILSLLGALDYIDVVA